MQRELLGLSFARRGHFAFESGMHGDLWLDLDRLFAESARVRPWAGELARRLAPHKPQVICGPQTGGAILARLVADELGVGDCAAERIVPSAAGGLPPVVERASSAARPAAPTTRGMPAVAYHIPAADRARLGGRRVAVVDDAINAGYAVGAVLGELRTCGAVPVALGALLVLNDGAASLAGRHGLLLVSLVEISAGLWPPADCPLCRGGVPLEWGVSRPGGRA